MHDCDEDDDRPIGRVLSRRDALTLLGAGGRVARPARADVGAVHLLVDEVRPLRHLGPHDTPRSGRALMIGRQRAPGCEVPQGQERCRHFKIRTKAEAAAFEFTSQWYFDEKLNERVLGGAQYARPGRRDTLNATDMIYRSGGDQLLLSPTQAASGLTASFAIGLDLANADAGRPDGFGVRGRGRGPGGPGGPGRGRRGGG